MRRSLTILLALTYLLTAGLGGGFWIVCNEHDHGSHVEPLFGLCCDRGDEATHGPHQTHAPDHGQSLQDCKTCVDSPLVIDSSNSSISSTNVPALQAAPDFWALPPVALESYLLPAAATDHRAAVLGTTAALQSLSTVILRC